MLIANQLIEMKSAEYISGYQLRLRFGDGSEKTIDFEPFLMQAKNPMITKYRNLDQFKKFRLEYGDLIWNDYELCFPIAQLYAGQI